MVSSFRTQLESISFITEPDYIEEVVDEMEILKAEIEREYVSIKQKILEMAKNGKYTLRNGKKEILFDYNSEVLDSFITVAHRLSIINRSFRNPEGDFVNVVAYQINEQKKYDFFMKMLGDLAAADNISITPVVFKYDKHYADKEFYEVPCVIQGARLTTKSYRPVLRCTVEY